MSEWLADNWIALASLAVAIVALVVATLPAYWTWRDRRRKLQVNLAWSRLQIGNETGQEFLEIKVVNKGAPQELTDLTFEVPGRGQYQTDHPDSVLLGPVETHMYTQSAGRLANGLAGVHITGTVQIRAVVYEKSGRLWKTNTVDFDVDRWLPEYQREVGEVSKQMAEELNRTLPDWLRSDRSSGR